MICPLSSNPLRDPILEPISGESYEREALALFLESKGEDEFFTLPNLPAPVRKKELVFFENDTLRERLHSECSKVWVDVYSSLFPSFKTRVPVLSRARDIVALIHSQALKGKETGVLIVVDQKILSGEPALKDGSVIQCFPMIAPNIF